MTDELTQQDKAKLLGIMDANALAEENYDHQFYEAMRRIHPLGIDEVDDDICRAILRYIQDGTGEASKPENGGFVIMGFVHGYMVGRELRRDIRRKRK